MKASFYNDKIIFFQLLLFPLANIGLATWNLRLESTVANIETFFLLKEVALLIFVAIAEELFFRGLLLRELIFSYKYKSITSAVLVSALFGTLHILNFFSYANFNYAILQGFCAFAVGFDLSAVYCKFKSVVPCILIHAIINVTSIGLDSNTTKLVLTNFEVIVFLLVAVLYLLHGYREFKSMNL